MTRNKSRLDYKWIILITCFLMELLCLGFCSSNTGLYTKAVTEALHIKRSVYSLNQSIRYIVQVVTALYFGTLIHKLGIKKMVCLGLISLTGSVVIRAYAAEVYHLYIGSAFWGFGMVLVGSTMASTIVRRWFHKDVGRYTGIVMSANGIGGAIAAQISIFWVVHWGFTGITGMLLCVLMSTPMAVFFGWLLGFGIKVHLMYPDDVVESFKAYLDKIRDRY